MQKNEMIILSLLLNNDKVKAASKIFDHIRDVDFKEPINVAIFQKLYSYYLATGKIISMNILYDTVYKKIDKEKRSIVVAYLKKIKRLKLEEDYNYYIKNLIEKSQRRKFINVLNDAHKKFKDDQLLEMINYVYEKIGKIIVRLSGNKKREGDYLDGFSERLRNSIVKKYKKNFDKLFFVPTGISTFDKYYGGLMPQELGIIMGGTGKGKSILLLNFGVSAYLKGYNVVIVTIEMPKLQYENRIDSRLTGIKNGKFRLSDLSSSDYIKWKKTINTLKSKRKNKIYIIDIPENVNTNVIKEKLLSLRNIVGDKYLLIIDYMNLMQPLSCKGAITDWQAQGLISRELKELARSSDIPIWTAVHPRRKDVKSEALTPEDVGLSYEIAKNADILMGLLQTQNDELDNIIRLQCVKGREGKCETVNLYPELDKMLLNVKEEKNE